MLDYRPKMFSEASKSHASKNLSAIIICFLAVFLIIIFLESLSSAIFSSKAVLENAEIQEYIGTTQNFSLKESLKVAARVAGSPRVMIPSLFSTIFGTLAAIFYCRCVEMRPVRSMGAKKKSFFFHYFTGIAVGLTMMSLIALSSAIFGITKIKTCTNVRFGILALFLVGFIIQGMSEEFIFRGYLMTSVGGSGQHTLIAVIVSAVAFALAHTMNPGFGVLPFINLTLFGVFAAVYMIYSDNIWGVCAIHSVWNFAQGNIYGISVSGSSDTESLFRSVPVSSHAALTGGKFGIEGSLITSVVLCAATAIMLYMISKKAPSEVPTQKETSDAEV